MSLFSTASDILTTATDTVTGTASTITSTPTPTTRTPTPTTRTPTPTTRTPTPTTRTPTPTTRTPTPTTATPVATTATPEVTSSTSTTSAATPSTSTTTTNAVTEATATSAPAGSDSSSASSDKTTAPATATANANASTTVIIQVSSQTGDSEGSSGSGLVVMESSDDGMSTGSIIGIVAGSLVAVVLIAGLIFWLYRRRRHTLKPSSPSFDASYVMAPITLPAANAVALESLHSPSPQVVVHNLNFDRTVQLDSTANLDSTLRLDSSQTSMAQPKKTSSSLWEDEAIMAARIPLEKITRKELINTGGHGEVYRGSYRCETVAIKVLLAEKRKDMRQINIFLSEIKMMASVEHPRIVRFIGVAWDALTDLCAVSEYMKGGDLFSLLRRFDRVDHRPQGFDGDKAKIALHVAQALTYLHSLDPIVLHRDLKSMNILLSSDWNAKVTDFGVSRTWTVDTMTAGVGTRRWMAPEVMMGKRYNTSADIFSFGVVLSELDSHQPPYASAIATITSESGDKVTETALMEMVAMGRVRVEFSPNAPQALINLGHACVDLDPAARPTAGEVHYQLQRMLRRYQQYTL